MAKRTRPGWCRSCGDAAGVDPDTFKPLAYCQACAAPAPKAAAFNRRKARLADLETVRTVTPVAPEAPKAPEDPEAPSEPVD